MSDSYATVPPSGFEPAAHDEGTADTGKVDAAKREAGDVKSTVTEQAGSVVGTAKDEAVNVAREAKSQAKDLYAQTRSELTEQAGAQQERVASGLRALGDELGSMASGSESQGLASDLVRQVSERAGSAASWLDARDPGSLLNEVKSYARRKPGTFIAAAALAGIVAGRLTRALASSAADEKAAEDVPGLNDAVQDDTDQSISGQSASVADVAYEDLGYEIPAASVDDTPLYTERVATFGDDAPGEDRR